MHPAELLSVGTEQQATEEKNGQPAFVRILVAVFDQRGLPGIPERSHL
jgi:hypothetical protein